MLNYALQDPELKDRLVDALMQVPSTLTWDGRTALMNAIPATIVGALDRPNGQFVDLTRMVEQLEKLGRLKDGRRPLIILAHNAWRQVRDTDLGQKLQDIERAMESAYGGDDPSPDLPAVPEILIFAAKDERVPYTFIERAQQVATRIARLRVPRVFTGVQNPNDSVFGTGWMLAPRLMITNHHVIEARDRRSELAASSSDFEHQAKGAVAWFDYHVEQEVRPDVRSAGLVAQNRALDYAVIRLEDAETVTSRGHLDLIPEPPPLVRGSRLNIVQHPAGGPLRYAIRNNFYLGTGDAPHQLRYLTDTEPGASGSPVLDDSWRVVALHHAYRAVPTEEYKGEIVKYHNEGIALHAILDNLPTAVRQEIAAAQGWS